MDPSQHEEARYWHHFYKRANPGTSRASTLLDASVHVLMGPNSCTKEQNGTGAARGRVRIVGEYEHSECWGLSFTRAHKICLLVACHFLTVSTKDAADSTCRMPRLCRQLLVHDKDLVIVLGSQPCIAKASFTSSRQVLCWLVCGARGQAKSGRPTLIDPNSTSCNG